MLRSHDGHFGLCHIVLVVVFVVGSAHETSSSSLDLSASNRLESNSGIISEILSERPQLLENAAVAGPMEPTFYYLRSGKRASSNAANVAMRASSGGNNRNQASASHSRLEKLNMLRTRRSDISRALAKKEASGQTTGKGDRWADFNLLRTGRADLSLRSRFGPKRSTKELRTRPNGNNYWDKMHLRTRRAYDKVAGDLHSSHKIIDLVPINDDEDLSLDDWQFKRSDPSKWLYLRTRKSLEDPFFLAQKEDSLVPVTPEDWKSFETFNYDDGLV